MARLVLPEAKVFREIVEAVGKLADEVAIKATPEGAILKALDIDQSSYIEVYLPSDMFLEYSVEGEDVIGVSIGNLKKILKHLRKGENLVIESSGDYVEFTVGTVTVRRYRFRSLDVALPEVPEFNLEFNVLAQLASSSLRKTLEDVESVGSIVEIEAPSSEALFIRSTGTGKVNVKFATGSLALLSLDVKEPSKSTYDVAKLTTVLNISEIADVVDLGFSSGMPLKMEFKVGTGRITYFLAPLEVG